MHTHEIGSLAKPEWRVKSARGLKLTPKDIYDAEEWGRKLGIDSQPLISLLKKDKKSSEDLKEIRCISSLYGLRLIEKAGIDIVYDGEQQRSEMYHEAASHTGGIKFYGSVRSFDNKYYKKGACLGQPSFIGAYHLQEFKQIAAMTNRPLKVPITGAYTFGDWSYDEFYTKRSFAIGTSQGRSDRRLARRQFILDVARRVIKPNIEALVKAGATWVQIDEPAVTSHPEEVPLFVESFNASTEGIKCMFSVHICFSDYTKLFPHIKKLKSCSQYALEFANRDSRKLGTKDSDRPGYQVLKLFRQHRIPGAIGLGVTDIHTDFLESPELVRDRILYAVKVMGDPRLVFPTPDCGLRTRSIPIAFEKMKRTVDGTRLAEARLA
ncbi:MAG: hypothetical protein WCV50_04140 [Patescibacteria group bacterium]|jgi:5-methyltetrahydropteroyltriglutamate--homocysteine methyltransferase